MTAGVVEGPGTAIVPAKPQPQEPKIAALKKLPLIVRRELLAALPPADRLQIEHDWSLWARPKQLPPPGKWEVWVALAGRSFGKALALDTPLPTPTGWTTMGDVKVGDTLFDERGQPCTVTFATEIQYHRTCYAVVFDDGTRVIADAEHHWLTWDKASRKSDGRRRKGAPTAHAQARIQCQPRAFPAVRTTEEIRRTLMAKGGKERNHSIPLAQPLTCSHAPLLLPPYTLGVWLGDGTSASSEVTLGDQDAEEILAHLARDGVHVTGSVRRKAGVRCGTYPIGGKPPVRDPATGRMMDNDSLHSRLKRLGVLKNKHIPAIYLRASFADRLALLHGLMDTDGSAERNGVEFCTTNPALAPQVLELARSLGFKATCKESRAKIYGRDVGPRWRITWSSRVAAFRLRRHLAKRNLTNRKERITTHRYIAAVEPVASVPVRCITVDSSSHLFLCSRAMIPTHNTRLGAEFCHQKADDMPGSRGALIGATSDDVRYTMIEGVSGILATQKPHNPVRYWPAKRLLKWKNGTQARTFTGEEPNRLRGPQHHWGWLDEWATFKYPKEAWDQFMLGKRLGTLAQACVTTTPKPFLELVKLITNAVSCWDLRGADPGDPILERLIATVVTVGTSQENKGNVSDAWYERTIRAYEGTRLYDQEVLGKILTDIDGALWKMATIEASRLMPNADTGELPKLPEMKRTVVAVDPAVTSGKHSNETGIVVCSAAGSGTEKHGYLREDLSGRYTPLQWATKAIKAYHEHHADRIIAEANNGGDLVKTNIQQVDGNVPVKLVHASKGKTARAEPVAAKSEQGRIHHVGVFAMLESQLTTYTPDSGLESPDRMDAYVWGFTDLLLGKQGAFVV